MANGFNTQFINNTRWIFENLALSTAPAAGPPGGLGTPAGQNVFDLTTATLHMTNAGGIGLWAMGAGAELPPLRGWWVPQGGSCVVPANPGGCRFVFTPDFSGCSLLVDQLNGLNYRVYHITGGNQHLGPQYTALLPAAHGLGLAAAMTFEDYASGVGGVNPRGFACMKYEGGRWWIYHQSPQGAPIAYAHGQLAALGPQTIIGCGRMPVANLTQEVPREPGRHGGLGGLQIPPAPRVVPGLQRQMLPNDEVWS